MAKKKTDIGIRILFGITFLSPITFSILLYEMDVIQRMVFYSISLLLFLVYLLKLKIDKPLQLNRLLVILFILYPLTFLTAFLNGSALLLPLKLSDIIIPLSVVLQSALMFFILGEEKFFKVVSYSVVIVSTVFSLIGLLEVSDIKLFTLPSIITPGSTLGHRGFAAEYLLSAIPFFLLANEYIGKEKKLILFIASIANVTFLLFLRSRAAMLILIAVVIIYFIFTILKGEKAKSFKVLIPVFIILVISFLISLIPTNVGERPDIESTAKSFFDQEFRSNVLRLNFWDASLQMIKEDPIVGKGLFKWSGYCPKYFGDYFNDKNIFYIHNIHAHNDFLEIFAESGIASLIIFISIYSLILLILFKRSKINPKYFPLLLTLFIMLAYSFVSFPNHKFASYFLAAVVSGVALINLTEKGVKTFRIKLNQFKWLLLSFLIIGGSISYIKLKSEVNYGQAINLKERREYFLMLQKLDGVSEIFYPFDPSKQPIEYYRGIANYYLGRNSKVLENNLSALDLAPYNPIIMRNVAGSYRGEGDIRKSIEEYEKVCRYFPNYLSAQYNLLDLYIESGQIDKAKILFNELSLKSPDDPRLTQYDYKF